MTADRIDKPIFIVGVPRSGTTLFYKKLALNADLAWITKTSRKFPRSLAMIRLISFFHRDRRTTEGSWIWRKFASHSHDGLGREDVTEEARAFYGAVIKTHLRLFGCKRFLSKYPRNALRMPFFTELFPDARFIHVIRDPRAVVNSLLRCRDSHGGRDHFWGVKPLGWEQIAERPPTESCAQQWKMTVAQTRAAVSGLTPGAYCEVRYEDFIDDPLAVMKRVGEHCELTWTDTDAVRIQAGIKSRNWKWRDALTDEDVQTIEGVVGTMLKDLGYT